MAVSSKIFWISNPKCSKLFMLLISQVKLKTRTKKLELNSSNASNDLRKKYSSSVLKESSKWNADS